MCEVAGASCSHHQPAALRFTEESVEGRQGKDLLEVTRLPGQCHPGSVNGAVACSPGSVQGLLPA